MTGLKVGPNLVEGTPHVWNGSEFVAPKGCYVWRDGEYVKVWPNFARQVMATTQNNPGQAAYNGPILYFASDQTFPAVVVDNELVVTGGGSAIVTVTIPGSGSIFSSGVEVRLNDDVVDTFATGSQSNVTVRSYDFALADGDRLTLWRESRNGNQGTLRAGITVDVAPAP